ncbi:MAG: PilZ domain-containing protein [Phycisphaerales bacterium]|nr:PilZ domain-containing protein [Phycisphaerales bacterium]
MAFHVSQPSPHDDVGANRRRHGRVLCDGVGCSLGQILDISASGARIRTKFDRLRPAEEMPLTIEGLDGPIAIHVQVMWIVADEANHPIRQMLTGVRFLNPNEDARRALIELARAAASNPTLRA